MSPELQIIKVPFIGLPTALPLTLTVEDVVERIYNLFPGGTV